MSNEVILPVWLFEKRDGSTFNLSKITLFYNHDKYLKQKRNIFPKTLFILVIINSNVDC